jgi:hypothetical protein
MSRHSRTAVSVKCLLLLPNTNSTLLAIIINNSILKLEAVCYSQMYISIHLNCTGNISEDSRLSKLFKFSQTMSPLLESILVSIVSGFVPHYRVSAVFLLTLGTAWHHLNHLTLLLRLCAFLLSHQKGNSVHSLLLVNWFLHVINWKQL